MQLNDFNFDLPPELIARFPLTKRSASRLLCIDSVARKIEHKQFSDVLDLVEPGDLLVFNDTRVIPARLMGQKTTGGQVEALVERVLDKQRLLAQIRASKAPRIGDFLLFPDDVRLEVINRNNQFYELQYNGNDRDILTVIESIGHIPLPHYMDRVPDEADKERYQTVYAKHKGSVAAPPAGLHFDYELIPQLPSQPV